MESKEKQIPVLFSEKSRCCGCGACACACPKQAITMTEDRHGFVYPVIDENLCIRCGRCKAVCAYQNETVSNVPLKTYAAVATDGEAVKKSASGGVFAALAESTLADGGLVCGAAFCEDWKVAHILIDDIGELDRLRGSKYTHSSTESTYVQTKQALQAGKKVLYSGTPCQIAGLYGYLGKDWDNLITVDIVCHGVPGNKMLREYLQGLETAHMGKLTGFTFRDKSLGWGINGSAEIQKKDKTVKIPIWQSASAYLYYFTKGWIYRENCYSCPYACANRPADLTLGDYWGIEKAHPEYLGKDGFAESKGISLVIVNTQKGQKTLDAAGEKLCLKESTFDLAAAGNAQLRHPSQPGSREELLKTYEQGGWTALESRFEKNIGWRKYTSKIKSIIPPGVKRLLKRIR